MTGQWPEAKRLAYAVLEAKEHRPKRESNTVFLDVRDWEYVKELARETLRELAVQEAKG